MSCLPCQFATSSMAFADSKFKISNFKSEICDWKPNRYRHGFAAHVTPSMGHSNKCFVKARIAGWVAGAGLSGAKEAPGFRTIALQPRPPEDEDLTAHLPRTAAFRKSFGNIWESGGELYNVCSSRPDVGACRCPVSFWVISLFLILCERFCAGNISHWFAVGRRSQG
jgi:hypothetical protein